MTLTPEQRDWLRLAMIPGVGTTYFIRLLARFHTPSAVLRASEGALREIVGQTLATRIAQYGDSVDVDDQERRMHETGASFLTLEDAGYPTRLAEIYDPPLGLFVRGELHQRDETCIAIVGTRRASPYGLRMAEKFARELAAHGVTVVSGMAAGVDAAAHRGAIEAGGRTIAVLGCGVDVVYPPQHADLMLDIARHGCALSQFFMGVKPSQGHFPYRNRIISGLALGVLVVEAPPQSGALITARQALEQGREVFAVPGPVGSVNSQGPHALIREGAKLTETIDDILAELDVPAAVRHTTKARPAERETVLAPRPPEPTLAARNKAEEFRRPTAPPPAKPVVTPSALEKDILSVLSPEGSFVDEIATCCRISISEALSSLTMLELKGLVRQYSGKRFAPA